MCLSKVTKVNHPPSALIESGWKVFAGIGSNKPFRFSTMDGVVELDKWLQASEAKAPTGLTADDGRKYKAGFHVYTDENAAKKFLAASRRVYMRNITCVGKQDQYDSAVAQEIYVPSDPNAWPPQANPPVSTAKKIMKKIAGKS